MKEKKSNNTLALAVILLSSFGHTVCNDWDGNNNTTICQCQVIVSFWVRQSHKLDLNVWSSNKVFVWKMTGSYACWYLYDFTHTMYEIFDWIKFCFYYNGIYFLKHTSYNDLTIWFQKGTQLAAEVIWTVWHRHGQY